MEIVNVLLPVFISLGDMPDVLGGFMDLYLRTALLLQSQFNDKKSINDNFTIYRQQNWPGAKRHVDKMHS